MVFRSNQLVFGSDELVDSANQLVCVSNQLVFRSDGLVDGSNQLVCASNYGDPRRGSLIESGDAGDWRFIGIVFRISGR